MTRHVPRRRGDPPRGAYDRLPFYGLYVHKACSSVVVDWTVHDAACHEHAEPEPDLADIGPDELAARAQAEGGAVVGAEFRATWREAWRQVAACLRVRPPKDPRPAAPDPPAAGRAEQWAAMDGLIKRTTEA